MRLGVNGRFQAARLTGVQRVARELTTELFARTSGVLFLPADAPELPNVECEVVRGRLRGQAWEQLELPRLARTAGIDVLLHPANSAPRQGGPHSVIVHDVLPLVAPHWFSRRYALWHRHVIRPAIQQADPVFTFTEWSARVLERECGLPEGRVRVVTQGLSPFDEPARAEHVIAARVRYALRRPYFLCLAPHDPRKNIDLLVAVMQELRVHHEDVDLVAVGRHAERIQGKARSALPAWVRVLRTVNDDELRALYTGALALCFPSHAEGFGRPPLEALACGTPALVGAYAAASEVFGTDVPVLPYETDAWLESMRALLEKHGERARLVEQASPLLAGFSWSRAASQILAELDSSAARDTVPA